MKSTTAFDDQFSEEPDDTLARTGNTSKEQDMYAAGLEAGEANAKNNAVIRAASASVAPGDALALLDHPLLRDVLGYIEDAGPADVWGSAQSWMALRDAALAAQVPQQDKRES